MLQLLFPFALAFICVVGPAVLATAVVFFSVYVAYVLGTGVARKVPVLRQIVPDDPDEVEERRAKAIREAAEKARIDSEIEMEIAIAEARAARMPVSGEDARLQIADARALVNDAEVALGAAEQFAKSMSGQWQAVVDARSELERAQGRLEEAMEDAKLYLPPPEISAIAINDGSGRAQRAITSSSAAPNIMLPGSAGSQDGISNMTAPSDVYRTSNSPEAHNASTTMDFQHSVCVGYGVGPTSSRAMRTLAWNSLPRVNTCLPPERIMNAGCPFARRATVVPTYARAPQNSIQRSLIKYSLSSLRHL